MVYSHCLQRDPKTGSIEANALVHPGISIHSPSEGYVGFNQRHPHNRSLASGISCNQIIIHVGHSSWIEHQFQTFNIANFNPQYHKMAQLQTVEQVQEALPSLPIRYADPEYNSTHHNLYKESLIRTLEAVLPPGVTQVDFDAAIGKLQEVLGHENVHIGKALTEYIDPYELQEDSSRRKVPSGAVWYV